MEANGAMFTRPLESSLHRTTAIVTAFVVVLAGCSATLVEDLPNPATIPRGVLRTHSSLVGNDTGPDYVTRGDTWAVP